jgi:hypothetical protein
MSSEFASMLYKSSSPVPAAYLPLFHAYIISYVKNPTEKDLVFPEEIFVIIRNMVGKDHAIGISKTLNSSTLFLFVAHIFKVHHKQIALFGDTQILTGDETMTDLLPLLEKTKNVLQVIINETNRYE